MKKAGLTAILCLLVCVLIAGLLSCGDKETQTEQTRETTQTDSQTEPEDMDSFWTPIV